MNVVIRDSEKPAKRTFCRQHALRYLQDKSSFLHEPAGSESGQQCIDNRERIKAACGAGVSFHEDPRSGRSVWLFRARRNHSCGTARDLHPFPPKDAQCPTLPAHHGAYIEFSGKKIESIDKRADVFRLRIWTDGLIPIARYLQAKKVT